MATARFYFFVQVKAATQGYPADSGVHHYENPRDERGQYMHRYESREDADRAADLLRAAGSVCRVEVSSKPRW